MKIADVFFKILLDDTGLLKDVVQKGDATGNAFGKRMGAAAGTALRGGLAVIAGGAAIAVRGLQELDDITAKFTAETGATAAEAKRAAEAINEMAGRNLQPLSEIGDTLIKVHTDMGLTGAAAEKLTEQFLKYATATGQNAVDAVKHFDDILDAWGLTAADAQGVMDKLIASHQKYGGSIEANEQALKDFAPQLKALNATIDDGIGLLNLFATAGLDAESATRALNTAVSKLKPGQSLNDLVAQIIAIKDPTDRAKKAIELFGAKGGVALANALKPGIGGLKDFEISAQDAAGATQKASDAIEGTFGNRIKLAIKAVGAEIIGLGQDFGPVLSGLAGLATLAGSLGLDKLIAKGWKGVASSGLVRGAAAEAGIAIGAVYGAAAGAAEHIVELVKDAWKELAGSGAVKLLAGKAGAIVGVVYGTAAKFAESIADAVSDAFVKLPFAPRVRAAVLAASIELGTLQGTAMGGAIAAAFAAAPLVIPLLLVPTLTKLPGLLPEGDQKKMAESFWSSLNDPDAVSKAAREAATSPAAQAGAASVGTSLGQTAGDSMVLAFKLGSEKAGDAMVAAWQAHMVQTQAVIHGFAGKIADDLAAVSRESAGKIADDLAGPKAAKLAYAASLRVMGAWAQGFRDGRDGVDNAWQAMLDGLKHPVSVTAETAKLLGELVSKKLQEGIHSGDPAVKDQAEYTKQLIIDRLNELRPRAGTLGKKAMDELRAAMKSKDPDVRAAATAIYNAARKPIAKLPPAGTALGHQTGANVASGIRNETGAVGAAAVALARKALQALFSTIAAAGGHVNATAATGVIRFAAGGHYEAGVPRIVGEHGPELDVPDHSGTIIPKVPSYAAPRVGSVTTSSVAAAPAVQVGTLNIYPGNDVSPVAAKRFGQRVLDEIATGFREQGARVGVHPKVVP